MADTRKKYNVTGNTWFYQSLKIPMRITIWCFYRELKQTGLEKIPHQHPVIFVPNHQNAFMDALILTSFEKKQLTFLMRASIFQSKLAAKACYSLNMLPVYRQMDGMENLDKNNEVFDNCMYLLENRRKITMYIEGSHAIPRRLRPLKKGPIRIAFALEEKHRFDFNTHIVPIGINYTDPHKFGGKVLINYAEPIPLAAHIETYKTNPAKAINDVRNIIKHRLSDAIIDIQSEQYYHSIERLREIIGNHTNIKNKLSLQERFYNDKRVIEIASKKLFHHNELAEETAQKIKDYFNGIKKLNLRDYMLDEKFSMNTPLIWLWMLTGIPFFIAGTVINFIPFFSPAWIAKKVVRDVAFKTSIEMSLGLFIFFFYYLFLFFALAFVLHSWLWSAAVCAAGIICAPLALNYFRKMKKLAAWMRFKRLRNSGDAVWNKCRQMRKEIISIYTGIEREYNN